MLFSPCQSHVFVPIGTLESDIIIISQYPMQCGNKWTNFTAQELQVFRAYSLFKDVVLSMFEKVQKENNC